MKYIKDFQSVGLSTLDIDLVRKKWNDYFSISKTPTYPENGFTYTFYVKKKNTKNYYLCKVKISEEQALELINKLSLIEIFSPLFRSSSTFVTKEFIFQEAITLEKSKKELEAELRMVNNLLNQYKSKL